MKLKAKISKKYLNQIISGEKTIEYRNVESIILSDGKRTREYKVEALYAFNPITANFDNKMGWMRNRFKDVVWKDNEPLLEIYLGDRVIRRKKI